MTAASLARRDAATDTGFTCRLSSLVCRHLPGALPDRCSAIDPTPLALAIARTHYDAIVAGGTGFTPMRATLAALGVLTTESVAVAVQREVLRQRMCAVPFAARDAG